MSLYKGVGKKSKTTLRLKKDKKYHIKIEVGSIFSVEEGSKVRQRLDRSQIKIRSQ